MPTHLSAEKLNSKWIMPRTTLLQVEEFYVITWEAKKEAIFEMPTGGAAQMRSGSNLLKLARKEQCLALEAQLRTKFKIDPCFYRVFPSGKVCEHTHTHTHTPDLT